MIKRFPKISNWFCPFHSRSKSKSKLIKALSQSLFLIDLEDTGLLGVWRGRMDKTWSVGSSYRDVWIDWFGVVTFRDNEKHHLIGFNFLFNTFWNKVRCTRVAAVWICQFASSWPWQVLVFGFLLALFQSLTSATRCLSFVMNTIQETETSHFRTSSVLQISFHGWPALASTRTRHNKNRHHHF